METEKTHKEEQGAVNPTAEQQVKEETHVEASSEEHNVEELHEDTVDYTTLSKEQLVEEADKLLHHADVVAAERSVRSIKEAIDHIHEEEKEAAKQEYVAAQGNDEGFDFHDSQYEAFFKAYKAVKERKKKHFEEMQKTRDNNLKAKLAIIDEIKALMESEDHRGIMAKVKELQAKWKTIGAVPHANADELYKTYGALLDLFYDQMSIEFELKELDRKKNLEAKTLLCDRAEKLLDLENVNEAVDQLNVLHEEFRSLGPVPKEAQEDLWKRFKEISDKIYDKKRAFAEEFKKQLNENMKAKQELCLAVEPFANFDSDRIKEWNSKTKELLAVQKDWEKIGPLPREVAKEINKQFWGNFKQFFHNKGQFFERLEAQRAENLELKKQLVAKAEELSESTDWRSTGDKLKQLQADWKKIGPVPEKVRDEVYAAFKKACDTFFENRRNNRKEEDKVFIENLKKKEDICLELGTLAKEDAFDVAKLNEAVEAFFKIGFVPKREKDAILDKFIKAAEDYVKTAKVSEEEMEDLQVNFHASVMKHVPNAGRRVKNQEQNLRHKITNLENDIALWQNNLAFFANSKTADQMKEEYQKKIEAAKADIERLKDRLYTIQQIADAR
ncbi:DUF349 domain-containing protein [Algivirga pacifica]|uniref:DUF349 domain-containing protein n=1 Tax=Algivirga pacifica TaxID=1162670 RepID=A0ABP9DMK2_9BACT